MKRCIWSVNYAWLVTWGYTCTPELLILLNFKQQLLFHWSLMGFFQALILASYSLCFWSCDMTGNPFDSWIRHKNSVQLTRSSQVSCTNGNGADTDLHRQDERGIGVYKLLCPPPPRPFHTYRFTFFSFCVNLGFHKILILLMQR